MVLPIIAYGDPILKKRAEEIKPDNPELKKLIDDMFETMYHASGVGLAAPQIGKSLRLFVIDAASFADDEDESTHYLKKFKKIFINPVIEKESGDEWGFNEGCLSIPGIREEVFRNETVVIRYLDEKFKEHRDTYEDYAARIIQHEYDHLEGKLFVEKIHPLRKRMIKRKLEEISNGIVDTKYKMKFVRKK